MKNITYTTSLISVILLLKTSNDLKSTSSVHSKLIKLGSLNNNTITTNHLINSYVKHNNISHARKSFDEITKPDVISFTSLMAGYIHSDQPRTSIQLFKQMLKSRINPNNYTFATAINACAQLSDTKNGMKLHALVEANGSANDLVVSTSLVGFYAKSNNIVEARKVFNTIEDPNQMTWGSLISGYAQNGYSVDAIVLFSNFLDTNVQPNPYILSSAVNACASMGRLGFGKSTHAKVVKYNHEKNEFIATTLIDMYAKCGFIEYSKKVFHNIKNPSLVTYTSMIAAAAKYGLAKLSLELFNEMLAIGIKPNEITFLAVLHACCHSGFVDVGLKYLNTMSSVYGIVPRAKHYTCVVDMLGRAGKINEAYKLIKSTEEKLWNGDEGLMVWSALLNASKIHKKLDIAKEAGEKLKEFGRDVAGAYVAMSNAYVAAGNWEGAMWARGEMKRRRIKKEPGCSWVEVKDVVHVFYATEVEGLCERDKKTFSLLKELKIDLGKNVHSEMLALGFGLLSLGEGVVVRIMKNLRMCEECHEKFKVISGVVEREFVVRDLNRFHQFKGGNCTCEDYWLLVYISAANMLVV